MGISRAQRCGKQPSRKADLPQALGDRRPPASREKGVRITGAPLALPARLSCSAMA